MYAVLHSAHFSGKATTAERLKSYTRGLEVRTENSTPCSQVAVGGGPPEAPQPAGRRLCKLETIVIIIIVIVIITIIKQKQ